LGFIMPKIRKQVAGRARTQGIGRKPRAELVKVANECVDALATRIGDGPFLFGDTPTTFDATAYAFALGALCPAFDNEIHKNAKSRANLVAYVDRLREKYWKE
jgi:glutathione S-transferase